MPHEPPEVPNMMIDPSFAVNHDPVSRVDRGAAR
jgi:hypothetical protein